MWNALRINEFHIGAVVVTFFCVITEKWGPYLFLVPMRTSNTAE